MVRISRQRAVSAAPGTARHSNALKHKTKAPYRIVLEQVTEKRRKLVTVLSFDAKAPAGYTFIPAGDPQITSRCKQIAREDGLTVYIVSTSKHKHKINLSHEVHRIGYHFPSLVVEKACMSLGISLTQSGHVLPIHGKKSSAHRNHDSLYRKKWTKPPTTDVSQATLDTEARQAIKDLFPKIPEKDLHAIICRAFQKGKDRVGTAVELPLPRRVQLAVVAHIRHVYTNYDRLLRIGTYPDARAKVEKPCLDLLAQWRSDDDDDANAMEEILREVIVIDDDDEDDTNSNNSLSNNRPNSRKNSVEIISSHAFPHEVQTHSIEYGVSAQVANRDHEYSPDSDITENSQYADSRQHLFKIHQLTGLSDANHTSIHRHRWKEALHRRRTRPLNDRVIDRNTLAQELITSPRRTLSSHRNEPCLPISKDQSKRILPIRNTKNSQLQGPTYIESRHRADVADPTQAPTHNDSRHESPRLRQVSGFRHANLAPEIPVLHMSTYKPGTTKFSKPTQAIVPVQKHLYHENRPMEPIYHSHDQHRKYAPSDYHIDEQPRIISLGKKQSFEKSREPEEKYPNTAAHHPFEYVSYQPSERIIPSVEDNMLNAEHRKDMPLILRELPHPNIHEYSGFDRAKANSPRTVDLRNELEAHGKKFRRFDIPSSFPHAGAKPPLHNPNESKTVLVPFERNDRWSDLHQPHVLPVHGSTVNSFASDKLLMDTHPLTSKQYSERQMPEQMINRQVPIADPQSGFIDHGHFRPMHHKRPLVPIDSASLWEPQQTFLPIAKETRKNSPLASSFPDGGHDDYSTLHDPLKPGSSSQATNVHLTRDYTTPRIVSCIQLDSTKSEENPKRQYGDFEAYSTRPVHHPPSLRQGRENFHVDHTSYVSPRDDPAQIYRHEGHRSDAFSRRTYDEYQMPSAEAMTPRYPYHNLEPLTRQRFDDMTTHDNLHQPQKPTTEIELSEEPRMQALRGPGNNRWYDSSRQLTGDGDHRRVWASYTDGPSNTVGSLQHSIYQNKPNPWGQEVPQEIIFID